MKRTYLFPELDLLQLFRAGVLCDSPAPGTNEQVTVEDWDDLVTGQ